MIAEAGILRSGLAARRRCGGRSCRCGPAELRVRVGAGRRDRGQLRQTKPICRCGLARPGIGYRCAKQSQFAGPGWFGGAAVPTGARGRVAPNEANFRLLGTENGGLAEKRSQFAGARWAGARRVEGRFGGFVAAVGRGPGDPVRARRPGYRAAVCQTKPICGWRIGSQVLCRKGGMGKTGGLWPVENKANLWGRDGSAVRPCGRELGTGSHQTKPIRRAGTLGVKGGGRWARVGQGGAAYSGRGRSSRFLATWPA